MKVLKLSNKLFAVFFLMFQISTGSFDNSALVEKLYNNKIKINLLNSFEIFIRYNFLNFFIWSRKFNFCDKDC